MNASSALSAFTLLLKLSNDPTYWIRSPHLRDGLEGRQDGWLRHQGQLRRGAHQPHRPAVKALDIAAAAIGAELDGLLVLSIVEPFQPS